MKKMQNILSKINWKSKKTIAAVTVAAAVLFAALTGVTALTVRHLNTEPAPKTTLPFAEEVTAAEADEVSTIADAANIAPRKHHSPGATGGRNQFQNFRFLQQLHRLEEYGHRQNRQFGKFRRRKSFKRHQFQTVKRVQQFKRKTLRRLDRQPDHHQAGHHHETRQKRVRHDKTRNH